MYATARVSRGPDGEFLRELRGQPEVFIGPKNSLTELHMDSGYTPFWMSVYIGKKIFRTITYEESSVHLPFYREGKVRWSKQVDETDDGRERLAGMRHSCSKSEECSSKDYAIPIEFQKRSA